MIGKIRRYFEDLEARQRIAIALARGARMASRRVDLQVPATWECAAFSQNGEDGVLDVLRGQLRESNRTFLEIGASDGIENNSAWLVAAEKYAGVMVEGDEAAAKRARRLMPRMSPGVECLHQLVTRDNAGTLVERMLATDPDVCSLDIDGNDYFIAQALLAAGLRPRIWVVEYNSAFGPERSVSVPCTENLDFLTADTGRLHYGVSVAGWRSFFARHGYRFVTVERNGVNAFFVDPAWFDPAFLDGIQGLAFAENRFQLHRFRAPWQAQFAQIAERPLVEI